MCLRPMTSLGSKARHEEGNTTLGGAVVSCANAVLGSGVLALPFAFKSAGILLGLSLLALSGIASWLSLGMLASCRAKRGFSTYEEGAEACTGRVGRVAVSSSVLLLQSGALVACINILGDCLSTTASSVVPPAMEPERPTLKALIVVVGLIPLSMAVRTGGSLASVSYLSVGLVGLFALSLVWFAFEPVDERSIMRAWDSSGALITLPVALFGFTAHVAFFPVVNELSRASPGRAGSVALLSILLCGVIYGCVGVSGYFAFGKKTAGNVLRNFDPSQQSTLRSATMRFVKAAYGASIVFTVPLVLVPIRETLMASISFALPPSFRRWTEHIITPAFLIACLACAVSVPNVELIFALVGATSSVMLGYVMPSLMYLATFPRNAPQSRSDSDRLALGLPRSLLRLVSCALIVVGSLTAAACTYETMSRMEQERQVAALAKSVIAKSEATASAAEAYSSASGANQQGAPTQFEAARKALESSVGMLDTNSDPNEAARLLSQSSVGLDGALRQLQAASNLSASTIQQPMRQTNPDDQEKPPAELLRLASDRAASALERVKSASLSLERAATSLGRRGAPVANDQVRRSSQSSSSSGAGWGSSVGEAGESRSRSELGDRIAWDQGDGWPSSADQSLQHFQHGANATASGNGTMTPSAKELVEKLRQTKEALKRGGEVEAERDAANALKLADRWVNQTSFASPSSSERNRTADVVAAATGYEPAHSSHVCVRV